MIIVGSWAASHWDWKYREPKDLDIWLCEGENPPVGKVDAYVANDEIYNSVPVEDGYATLDALYTIKLSHLGWDVHWDKTKQDVLYLQSIGGKLLPDLYRMLVRQWGLDYGNKDFLSLNKTKDDFFDDEVTYTYDHDYLHELVAYPDVPVYTRCLKEGQDVLIDKVLFDSMDFRDQIKMFKEEIVVIACERWVLNPYFKGSISWYKAYILSLKKTITNLTKGWATEFITKNLKDFVIPEYSHFEYILTKLRGNKMSDLKKMIEVLAERVGECDLEGLVYKLCEGGSLPVEVEYPNRGDRKYMDESYQTELTAYNKAYSAALQELCNDVGYEHLDQEGGGEGGSEYCYGVFRLGGKILKAEYSYASHCGHDYSYILDTLREVVPEERTVTVYV